MRWLLLVPLVLLAQSFNSASAAAETPEHNSQIAEIIWSQRTEVVPPTDEHGGQHSGQVDISNDLIADFDMIGFLWDSGAIEELWLQTRDGEGRWSDWSEVPFASDHGGDSDSERPGSSPVYTNTATAARFAIVGDLLGSEAMLLDTEAVSAFGLQSAETPVVPPEPWWSGADFVRDREEWDTNSCRNPEAQYHFSTVQAIVVHHAGSNGYTQAAVPGIIRGFCEFHVNGRGWNDIGYNFLVDRFGDVWEGRTASKTTAISGAHTTGFNSSTQGVAMIGNFQQQSPSNAQLDGLRQILGWLTGWHSIDPTGQVTLFARLPINSLWTDGQSVVVPTIIGHRDLGSTACPGARFYATLAALRASIQPDDFGIGLALVRCAGRIPTIVGTLGPDQMRGTPGADIIHGLDGNDLIDGVEGDDIVCGGFGDDYLVPGSGFDRVLGEDGFDTCGGDGILGCEAITNDEMFFYRDNGVFRYDDVNPDGTLGSPILNGSGYTAGWDSITSVDLEGDGQDEMFFYRDDGLFRYYEIDPNGNLGSPISAGDGYTENWSSITAVDLDGDGQDEMFFYRDDGLFRYYNINPNGTIGSPILAGSGYTVGWDAITSVDLDGDGQDEMFFYRDDGLFRYYNINPNGTIGSPINLGSDYPVWDVVTAINLDGS